MVYTHATLGLIDWNVLPFTGAVSGPAESRIFEKHFQVLLELVTLYLGVTASVNTCALGRRN